MQRTGLPSYVQAVWAVTHSLRKAQTAAQRFSPLSLSAALPRCTAVGSVRRRRKLRRGSTVPAACDGGVRLPRRAARAALRLIRAAFSGDHGGRARHRRRIPRAGLPHHRPHLVRRGPLRHRPPGVRPRRRLRRRREDGPPRRPQPFLRLPLLLPPSPFPPLLPLPLPLRRPRPLPFPLLRRRRRSPPPQPVLGGGDLGGGARAVQALHRRPGGPQAALLRRRGRRPPPQVRGKPPCGVQERGGGNPPLLGRRSLPGAGLEAGHLQGHHPPAQGEEPTLQVLQACAGPHCRVSCRRRRGGGRRGLR